MDWKLWITYLAIAGYVGGVDGAIYEAIFHKNGSSVAIIVFVITLLFLLILKGWDKKQICTK